MSAKQAFLVFFGFVLLVIFFALRSEKLIGQTWFEKLIDPEKGDTAGSFYKILASALLFALTVFLVAFLLFASDLTFTEDWAPGTFGDFIGGVLNPILTFFTFLGLLITIVLQQREIRLARQDAKNLEDSQQKQMEAQQRQSFEVTFFQMLTVHNTIVNSMDIKTTRRSEEQRAGGTRHGPPESHEYRARDCFTFFYDELKRLYAEQQADENLDETDRVILTYEKFWLRNQGDLGHYFRYLFNVVRFIDEKSPEPEKSNPLTNPYMKLLRAQLSDHELFVLFYNCLTRTGEAFKGYVERYVFLNNLPTALTLRDEHRGMFYNESAFRAPPSSEPAGGDDRDVKFVPVR